MVRPAAPWFRWGLLLWFAAVLTGMTPIASVATLLAVAGSGLLAVGVYRLVQHADRAAGVETPVHVPPGISAEERARQAAARAALAAGRDTPPAADQ